MRIAVVHSFYSEAQPSGENNVVRDQVAALRAAGHDVQLMARHTDEQSRERLYAARSALTTMSGRGPSPAEELQRFRPDVVHLHNTFPNWGTTWLKEWAARTVVTLHNYRPVCANGLLFRDGHPCQDCLDTPVLPAVIHRCYRSSALASVPLAVASAPRGALRGLPLSAKRVVCLNRQSASVYERVLHRPIDVVPNFVPRVHSMAPGRPQGWVYVGRLSSEKGVEELLQRWPQGAPLDLVGDGPLAPSIQSVARQRPEVRMRGSLRRSDLVGMLGSYEGLILPSMCAEQLPTAVLEALAVGTPSLLSHHVNAAEQLRTLGAAEVFDPIGSNSVEAPLARIRAARPRMSSAASQLYEAEYAPEVWLGRILDIYQEILEAN